MAFEILDGISRADIAFRVRGKGPEELFSAGARALVSIMLHNAESVRPLESIDFSCEAPELDILYFDFLSEFIFLKDSSKMILLPERVRVERSGNGYTCSCTATGERLDRTRHTFAVDIKAITMHRLVIEQNSDGWSATVVVDV